MGPAPPDLLPARPLARSPSLPGAFSGPPRPPSPTFPTPPAPRESELCVCAPTCAQVLPYLQLLRDRRNGTLDAQLQALFRGVIAQQTANALLDPYANAFQRAGSCPG